MKNSLKSILLKTLCLAGTLLLPAGAIAQVIITIDLSNPAAAVFQTTTANAQGTFTDTALNGLCMQDFFNGNTHEVNGSGLVTGAFQIFNSPSGSTTGILNRPFVFNLTGGFTTNDFAVYNFNSFVTYTFVDQPALSFDVTSKRGDRSV